MSNEIHGHHFILVPLDLHAKINVDSGSEAMSISVLIEPKGKGFRASTKSPVTLSAEGTTEAEALTALRSAFDRRMSTGGRIVDIPFTRVEEILQTAHAVGENPLFEEYLKAIEEYRKIENAIPDAE